MALALHAYWLLVRIDLCLARSTFADLYEKVRAHPLGATQPLPNAVERICSAVDMACIWYWKEVLCLQRSVVTVCLLKRYGVHAQLVIGTQKLPFKAHAWAEVAGRVVNDKPYMRDIYSVLDRC